MTYDWSTFDREAFRHWLVTEAPGVVETDVEFWMRMVDHRYPWTCRRVAPWNSPQQVVEMYENILHGVCAWVAPDGKVFPCNYAHHDTVAAFIIGASVVDIETTYARLSTYVDTIDNVLNWLERPTSKQRRALEKRIERYRASFPHFKDF